MGMHLDPGSDFIARHSKEKISLKRHAKQNWLFKKWNARNRVLFKKWNARNNISIQKKAFLA